MILAIYKITGSVDIADKYSEKGSNYEDGIVEKKINSCRKFQFGEGTIRHYAKLSNESKYNEIRARFMKFDDIENITDKDLAEKVLKKLVTLSFTMNLLMMCTYYKKKQRFGKV